MGGIRSARGVLGFWFDKYVSIYLSALRTAAERRSSDFDEHGPAGPTAFWKSHDGIEEHETSKSTMRTGLHGLHIPMY